MCNGFGPTAKFAIQIFEVESQNPSPQCDGFGPTVTFVILGNKRVFGGYTTVPWTVDNQPRVDREAFLFSLSGKP
jgi:hypothetical protein